jgi:enoyl-CoA hydratase
LSRAPGELGTYYGLTGTTMGGTEAVYAHLADAVVAAARWPELREALTRAPGRATSADVRAIIDRFATSGANAPIAAQRSVIDTLFGHDSIEDIVAALAREKSEWAQKTLQAILANSPTGLKLTLKLLRLARASTSLEQCLAREYRAALEIFVNHDFPEGIRAAVIDKDRNPRWSPSRIEDVTPELIARYFAPHHDDQLNFPN